MTGRTRSEERTEKSVRPKLDAELDADLDAALAETFPASDPFSVGQSTATEPPARSIDHKAPRPQAAQGRGRRRKSKKD